MAKVSREGSGDWEELTDFRFNIDRENIGLTRTFKIPNRLGNGDIDTNNANVFTFLRDCFPDTRFAPGQFLNTAFRAYVDEVEIVPFQEEGELSTCDPDGEVAAYAEYKATVSYSRLDYEPAEEGQQANDPETGEAEHARHSRTFGTESLLLPEWGMEWEKDHNIPVPKEIRLPIIIPYIEHRFEFLRLPDVKIPKTAIADLGGHVNESQFSGNNKFFPGAAKESVLFVGADTTRTVTVNGDVRQTLGLTFRQRLLKIDGEGLGWNHYYNPHPDAPANPWDRLISVNGGHPTHPTASTFFPLFNIVP